ncbi:ABC transporter ATP-binding protein [Stenotrophomonas maltophilia]|uniref:ABC transporter ATP-binding protein n=2 Tax=Stenotrophomonas maltophilia TaxID=40324 RepID=A0A270NB29_STEMA|nr:ABC transporter ATP-binding protein [Stenotrophomonas maltophilia]
MSSDPIALKVDGVSKHYEIYASPQQRLKAALFNQAASMLGRRRESSGRRFSALDDVSFSIRKGETVGIIGRNGSGKSTLLQLLSGTLSPSAGQILVDGRVAPLLELGAGFNPEFTGRENVFFNGSLLGLSEDRLREKYDSIVEFADIGEFIDQPVKTYSSGMFVRLAFAVIAHVEADILVIDEALSVGDAFFVQKCMRFLREFMKNGTVVFVSHDTAAVINLCDRVIWLSQGKVVADGSPKEVTAKYLEDLYAVEMAAAGPAPAAIAAEAAEGARPAPANEPGPMAMAPRDFRQDLINASAQRVDIRLFEFNRENGFGLGGAQIESVSFVDASNRPLAWVIGGEAVRLQIRCRTQVALASPIIGFEVYDRLGQTLFADNTYVASAEPPPLVAPGEVLTAAFDFRMPVLREGDYTLSAAIADGNQERHVQHHWLHDALAFHVHAKGVCLGMFRAPMQRVHLAVEAEDAVAE